MKTGTKGRARVFSDYVKKHGKPYTVRIPNGEGTLSVMFYDGYVILRSTQPGIHYATEVGITLKSWRLLLPKLVRPTRMMKGPSKDPNALQRIYMESQRLLEADRRAAKRGRDQAQIEATAHERKRQRYERAKARAQRTTEADATH